LLWKETTIHVVTYAALRPDGIMGKQDSP
jgi:hypothetical protein